MKCSTRVGRFCWSQANFSYWDCPVAYFGVVNGRNWQMGPIDASSNFIVLRSNFGIADCERQAMMMRTQGFRVGFAEVAVI